jgi:hypothetical protein
MTYKIPAVSVILNQFPEFTREDYPAFIKFVELYYKHLNETQVEGIGQSFDSIRDVDTTLDKFIDELWKEFGINIPRTNNVNDRYFLKHIKEFYSAKGSEESFRMLFRHLYNTEIEIKYPKEQILKTSDGTWTQDISVLVQVTSGNIFDIIDQQITISTNQQSIKVVANRIRLLDDGYYEVFLDKFQRDLISVGSILSLNNISATVVETVSKITVFKSGIGFYVGQIFTLPSVSGANARIKITKVGPIGELLEIQILDFGSGYTSDFNTTIVSGSTPSLIVEGELSSQTLGFVDSGFISSNFYSELEYTTGSYSGETIREFYTQIDVPEGTTLDDEKVAVLLVSVGSIRRYPGFYSNSSGFLSDAYHIQDGHYYQDFSYVVSCVESINTYRNIVKSLLHPSGFKIFGNQLFSNQFDVVGTLQLINRYFQQALSDTVDVIDDNKYVLNKPFANSTTTSDINYIYYDKQLSEELTLAETEIFAMSKPVSDSLILTEETTTVLDKPIDVETLSLSETETFAFDKPIDVETLSLSETETFAFDKPIDVETLSLSETEVLSFGKSISDAVAFLKIYYWESTYADSEYIDTNIEPVISKAGSTYSISLTN